MKSLKLAAFAALLSISTLSTLAVAHGDKAHAKKAESDAVRKEQKPWGIAAEAMAAVRTIEVRMSDQMRFSSGWSGPSTVPVNATSPA